MDLCIQLGPHFQGISINIIIDNMKTVLAFLALAALATARPEGRQAQVCPKETPLPCEGKYLYPIFVFNFLALADIEYYILSDYCVASQAECPVPIMRQSQVCPKETPLPCEGNYIL